MEEQQGEQYRAPRFGVTLVGIFASFGLILAAAGVYGVMSYSVVQRSSEIGIRMALGAQRTNIAAMILGEGLKIAAIGITVGLIGAIAAGRLLGKLLFDVKPTDAATLVGVSLVFFSVLLLACYVPMRRAIALEPVEVLRHD